MEILLNVSYVLDTEKYDFWDKETGYPNEEHSCNSEITPIE